MTNLLANPTSDIQTVNGISFSLSSGQTSVSSFTETAVLRRITSNSAGGYSDTGTPTTAVGAANMWNLHSAGLGIEITSIGNTGGHPTLVGAPNGSNAYLAANGSILADPHQPFLAGTATFDLTILGVTSNSDITSMRFEFGTYTGTNVQGGPLAPEPGSISLAVFGFMGLAGYGVRRRKLAKVQE